MRRLVTIAVLILVASALLALDTDAVARADELYDADDAKGAVALLERALPTAVGGRERAEVLWRLSRATLKIGEQLQDAEAASASILETFERGEQYAVEAVQADADNHLGYYWQSANTGKWGREKGVLNSLFKAGPMRDLLRQAVNVRPTHAASYYVLGQLYAAVPGVISFGNKDYAVGLARLSVALHEEQYAGGEEKDLQYDYYIQLASHLIDRNWNSARRQRELEPKRRNYHRTTDPLERGWYYESVVAIPDQTDRQEAETLLGRMIAELSSLTRRNEGQERQLKKARELLAGL